MAERGYSMIELEAMKLVPELPGWVPWQFRSVQNGIICKGAVCPLVTRGRRKGEPNYRKADMKTVREVFVPFAAKSD